VKIKHYKIYCETDDKWEHHYLPEDDPEPTTCPVDTAHTVTTDSVSVAGRIGDEFSRTDDGSLKTTDRPATEAYEMCDRDMLLRTTVFDTRAQAVLQGVDPDGHIVYTASTPGSFSNRITIEYTAGASGAGNENRPLGATLTPGNPTWDLAVIYGTDANGNPIVPTAGSIASMFAQRADLMMVVFPTLLGDGSSLVQVTAPTSLAGGTSASLEDIKIDPTTFEKLEWAELQQVGVYKKVGGDYVGCTDQADATSNACLSVWRYCAHNQQTGVPTIIEVRDGYLIVDADLDIIPQEGYDPYEHQAYAIGAPLIPAIYGGQIVQFDAYLKYFVGKQLGATSPQAKALDPAGPGGPAAAELRIHIYYPKGTANTHVLRLVTYRPSGTF
jgi:hypothetical protein